MKTLVNRVVGTALTRPVVGRIAAKLLRNRVPHRGLVVDTSDPVVTPPIKAALLFRAYESAEYRFTKRYLPRDIDVVELGGSIGVISCTLRRHIASNRSLTVVEADSRLARVLRRNLVLNGCEQGTTVREVAIAYGGADTVQFTTGASSVSGRIADANAIPGTVVEVPARTLRQVVVEAGVTEYALISDVEGVEWDVLDNDLDTLAGARVLIMETHARAGSGSHDAFIARLLATGRFTLLAQHGAVVALKGQRSG